MNIHVYGSMPLSCVEMAPSRWQVASLRRKNLDFVSSINTLEQASPPSTL